MDPQDIQDISEWNQDRLDNSRQPSHVSNYKLTGMTTFIPNAAINVRSTLNNKGAIMNFVNSLNKKHHCVCVREIRLDWSPHVEPNHVSFMEVKINNTFKRNTRSNRAGDFFIGMFPIHVHWSVSVSSPRWIDVSNYVCNSPWSYSITARDMPQEELQNAGSLTVSYTIEKGTKDKESQYNAPKVVLDTAPFPYMVPFYKFVSPGGLYESNISNIIKVIRYMEKALIGCGVNNKISEATIWGMANTMNSEIQSQLVRLLSEDKNAARNLIEQIIQGVINHKTPGFPSYDTVKKMSEGSLDSVISKEILGIGDEIVSLSRRFQ